MAQKYMFCLDCHWYGPVSKKTRGNFFTEIVLWGAIVALVALFYSQKDLYIYQIITLVAFAVPACAYSLWRLTTRYYACPACSHDSLIPSNSPRAQAQIAIYQNENG